MGPQDEFEPIADEGDLADEATDAWELDEGDAVVPDEERAVPLLDDEDE